MAKEFDNNFYKDLKNKVVDDSYREMAFEELKQALMKMSPERKKEVLEQVIPNMEANVIKDPKALEYLKRELAKANKKIKEEEAAKAVETGEVVGKDATEKDIDEENKKERKTKEIEQDGKSLEQEEQDEKKEEELKRAYHDAIVTYYNKRLETLNNQLEAHELIASDLDYKKEAELEYEMYKAREQYLALGGNDPYEKFRANHSFIDRQAHEPFDLILREKARKYREAEEEIAKLDEEIVELNEKLTNTDLTDIQRKEYQNEVDELNEQKKNWDLQKAEYKDAAELLDKQTQREDKNAGLQQMRRDAASKEEIKGYDYQRQKKSIASHNVKVAEKTEYNNIETMILAREKNINKIKKKLKETPDSDIKTRLELLGKLNEETNNLEAAESQKEMIDRGYSLNEVEMQKETSISYQKVEQAKEDFIKDTSEVREAVKAQDEHIGAAVVEKPTIVTLDSQESLHQNGGCVIPELDGKVKIIDNSAEGIENAKEYLEQDEQLRKADNELDKVQTSIENKTQV